MESYRSKIIGTKALKLALTVLLMTYIIFVMLYPMSALLARFQNIQSDAWGLAWMSIKQSFLSTFFSMIIGVFAGVLANRVGMNPGQRSFFLIPFALPSLIAAQVALSVFDMGLSAVVLAHVVLNAPWIAWVVAEALSFYPQALKDAARTLGVDVKQELKDFTIPYLMPQVLAAALQVFSYCLMSFSIVLLIGGGPPVQTLETEIYSSIRLSGFDLDRALSCALLQLGFVVIPTVGVYWYRLKAQNTWGVLHAPLQKQVSYKSWIFSIIFMVPFILGFLVDPAIWDQKGWIKLFSKPEFWSGLSLSMILAFCTSIVVLAVSVASVFTHRMVSLFISTWSGVSSLVMSLAFFMAYARWMDLFLIRKPPKESWNS